MSFKRPIIPLHIQYSYIYTWRNSPCFSIPFVPPLCPLLLTWHPPAVTGIVHLGLRLLINWPTLTHPFLTLTHPSPSKFPEPQLTQRPTKPTSGIFRTLLSGTRIIPSYSSVYYDEIQQSDWHNFLIAPSLQTADVAKDVSGIFFMSDVSNSCN